MMDPVSKRVGYTLNSSQRFGLAYACMVKKIVRLVRLRAVMMKIQAMMPTSVVCEEQNILN